MFKPLRSVSKLVWLLARDLACLSGALLKGNPHRAADHARSLAVTLHDDLLKGIAALNRRLPGWRYPPAGIHRILIVKLDRIGDMVNTTPVFDALRAAYPQARLDLVGHPGSLSLLEGDDRIDERIPYKSWLYHPLPPLPGGPRAWWLMLRLLRRRYPLVVYLRGSFPFLLLGLTSRLAAARYVEGERVVQRYLKPLEQLGLAIPTRRPRLQVNAKAADFAHQLLARDGGSLGPRIVIHPSASAATKMWPAERYAALADRLGAGGNAQVHFLGSADDQALLEGIAARAVRQHHYHCGLRLSQVVAVLAACDLFIGNDSGLSHIAGAVGTRLVVLWGAANLIFRPEVPPENCTVLYREPPCRARCPQTHCSNPIPMECLRQIETQEVVEAALSLLDPAQPRRRLPLPLEPVGRQALLARESSFSTESIPS